MLDVDETLVSRVDTKRRFFRCDGGGVKFNLGKISGNAFRHSGTTILMFDFFTDEILSKMKW